MPLAIDKAQEFIVALMAASHLCPAQRFKEEAFYLLKGLLPFDKGIWISGQTKNIKVHNAYVHNLPADIMDNWEKIKHQDRLIPHVIKHPGRTFDIMDIYTRSERASLELYRNHSRLYGIENVVCTALPDPGTGLLEAISLYRARPEAVFSQDEREFKQFVFPFLIQAWQLNQGGHFRNLAGTGQSGAVAIADPEGLIRHVEQAFMDLAVSQWPDWTGPLLPGEVSLWLTGENRAFKGGRLVLSKIPVGDLFLIQARPPGLPDLLTRREEEVASSFAAGLTHKEIGRELGLSPFTVRGHLESIYRKLEVSNKVELIQALNPED